MTPRASFVIPAFNAERWLSKTLFSCRHQSIKQIEIVVVNDGSTDGTRDIIDWHVSQDDRVVPVHLDANVGRSAARNIGNSKVSSDIILVLDADDMACRNRVKDTLAAFQLKKPDLVYGSFFVMDSLGNVSHKVAASPFNRQIALERKQNSICHSTMAYRKGVTLNVQYDEGEFSDLGLDDWKFQWDAVLRGYKLSEVKTPLSYYRATEDSVSTTRDDKSVLKAKEAFLATVEG